MGKFRPGFAPTQEKSSCGLPNFGEERRRPHERRLRFEDCGFRTTQPRAEKAKFRPESDPARFAFLPGARTVLVGCNGVQLITLIDGKVLRTFHVEQ